MKKTFNKFTSFILALIMVAWLIPIGIFSIPAFAEGEGGTEYGELLGDDPIAATSADGFTYYYKDDKAVITGYEGTETDITIPETVDDKTVIGFGKEAFAESSITSVNIESNVTDIPTGMFYGCRQLVTVTMSDSVTTIQEYAFCYCTELTTVNLSDNILYIESGAFCYCSKLSSIDIPEDISYIGSGAFGDCEAIKEITLIGTTIDGGFKNSGLEEITLENVTISGYSSFSNNVFLKTVNIKDVDTIEWHTFSFCTSLEEVNLIGINEIDDWAFEGCTALTKIILPDGTTTIGSQSFKDCATLSAIYIPSSVETISEDAFENDILLDIYGVKDSYAQTYAEENGINFIEGAIGEVNAGSGTEGLFTYSYKNDVAVITDFIGSEKNVVIPATIGGKAIINFATELFKESDITSVEINANVTYIPAGMFESCTKLETVNLPDSINKIEKIAFGHCSTLSTINIPKEISLIGWAAFLGCESLKAIDLKGTKIDASAFLNTGLTEITLENVSLEGSVFSANNSLEKAVLKNVENIPNNTFNGCSSLKEVSLSGTKTIGNNAFESCSQLEKIVLPDGATTIEENAFKDCALLSGIYLPSSISSVASNAFESDALLDIYGIKDSYAETYSEENSINFIEGSIGNIAIENGTADSFNFIYSNDKAVITGYIGENKDIVVPEMLDGKTVVGFTKESFKKSQITSIEIKPSVTEIPSYMFSCCGNLKTVVLPNSVVRLKEGAFFSCGELTTINIPENISYIGDEALAYCSKLGDIEIPENISYIGQNAFHESTGLKEISLKGTKLDDCAFANTSLETIKLDGVIMGQNAFTSNSLLKTIIIKDVKEIPYQSFCGCTSLKEVNLLEVEEIGHQAFLGCTSLSKIVLPDGLTTIAIEAFKDCTILSGIYIPSSVYSIALNAFENDYFLFISTDSIDGDEYSNVEQYAQDYNIPYISIDYDKDDETGESSWSAEIEPEEIENYDSERGLYIMSSEGIVWFNPEAVANIKGISVGHDKGAHVGWQTVDETPDNGNEKQQDAIEYALENGSQVYNFTLDAVTGKVEFGTNGGAADLTIPVIDKNLKQVSVYYIDDFGNKIPVQSNYDKKTGVVTLHTTHFSYYVVEDAVIEQTPVFSDNDTGVTGKIGDTITVPVYLNSKGQALKGYGLNFSYDSTVLEYVSCTDAETFVGTLTANGQTAGKVNVTYVGTADSTTTGAQKLFDLKFKIKDDKFEEETSITLEYDENCTYSNDTAKVAVFCRDIDIAISKADVKAPTGITSSQASSSSAKDGSISGVTTAMEYKKSNASDWTACTGTTITGLGIGTYYVRYQETATANASANKTVTISYPAPVHSHYYNQKTIATKYLKSAATCTSNAIYYYSCSCGDKGTSTFEATGTKLNHTFDQQVTTSDYFVSAATCTEKAKYYYSCTCGECGTETFEYGEALNHNYNSWESYSETQHKRVCVNDASHIEYAVHNWNEGIATTAATCTETGIKTYTCSDCNATKTETIPLIDHDYKDGVCTKCGQEAPKSVEKIDGTWYFTINGEKDITYNGIASNENGTWLIEEGKVTFKTTGVIKAEDGKWYNVVKSKVVSGPTVAKNDNGWWYIDENGVVDFSYTGFATNKNGTWYIEKGKVRFNKTSVIKNKADGKWYNVIDSKITTGVTVAKNENGWWYIDKNGKVDFSYTGLATNKNGTWYVKNGKVDFNFNGTYQGYTIKNSKVVK